MSELKNLSVALEGGTVPVGYNEKLFRKLSKSYLKLENRKVVNLYPVRFVMHKDSRYCLYACPLEGTEISGEILQSIKAEVDMLEISEIRYDSVQSSGFAYYIVDCSTGRHLLTNYEDMDSVMEISDLYDGVLLFTKTVFSKKASQLDCHYAFVGLEKQPNEIKIEPISNEAIGQVPSAIKFEGQLDEVQEEGDSCDIPESPAAEKYRSAMTVLSVIITVGVLIWYFFLK